MPYSYSRSFPWMLVPALLAVAVLGCSQSSQQERIIPLKASASLLEARALLENYAKGSPVTSEADSFDTLVEGVRKEDPKAANTLSEVFKKIKENPGARKGIAKKALKELPEAEPRPPAGNQYPTEEESSSEE